MTVNNPRYWIAVYFTNSNDFHDIGNDPYFRSKPFTWGVCRPDLRRILHPGDYVYFVGKQGTYFLNGYFKVDEMINYEDALKKFSERENTLISKVNTKKDFVEYLKDFIRNENPKWKDSGITKNELLELDNVQKNLSMEDKHLPFFYIRSTDKVYIHRKDDGHETDNWKCRRIFNCNIQSKKYCLANGVCYKEKNFENQKYYIIGNEFESSFINSDKFPFEDLQSKLNISILSSVHYNQSLRRGNKHPKLEISKEQHLTLRTFFN